MAELLRKAVRKKMTARGAAGKAEDALNLPEGEMAPPLAEAARKRKRPNTVLGDREPLGGY